MASITENTNVRLGAAIAVLIFVCGVVAWATSIKKDVENIAAGLLAQTQTLNAMSAMMNVQNKESDLWRKQMELRVQALELRQTQKP